MNQDFKITIPITRAYKKDNGFYVEGIASTPDLDSFETIFNKNCQENFAFDINEAANTEEPIVLEAEHRGDDEPMNILGPVERATVNDDGHLHIVARLDSDNPKAQYYWNLLSNPDPKLGRPKRLGFSINGVVREAHYEFNKDLNKPIRVFDRVKLNRIGIVRAPSNPNTWVDKVIRSVDWTSIQHKEIPVEDQVQVTSVDAPVERAANHALDADAIGGDKKVPAKPIDLPSDAEENEKYSKEVEKRGSDEEVEHPGDPVIDREHDRNDLSDSEFAFPKQRKMPINDASHVRNALARFDQVKGVTAEEKAEAMRRIKAAAKKFGVEVGEERAEAHEATEADGEVDKIGVPEAPAPQDPSVDKKQGRLGVKQGDAPVPPVYRSAEVVKRVEVWDSLNILGIAAQLVSAMGDLESFMCSEEYETIEGEEEGPDLAKAKMVMGILQSAVPLLQELLISESAYVERSKSSSNDDNDDDDEDEEDDDEDEEDDDEDEDEEEDEEDEDDDSEDAKRDLNTGNASALMGEDLSDKVTYNNAMETKINNKNEKFLSKQRKPMEPAKRSEEDSVEVNMVLDTAIVDAMKDFRESVERELKAAKDAVEEVSRKLSDSEAKNVELVERLSKLESSPATTPGSQLFDYETIKREKSMSDQDKYDEAVKRAKESKDKTALIKLQILKAWDRN